MVGTKMPRPKIGRRVHTAGKWRATDLTSTAPGGRCAVPNQRQRPLPAGNYQAAWICIIWRFWGGVRFGLGGWFDK